MPVLLRSFVSLSLTVTERDLVIGGDDDNNLILVFDIMVLAVAYSKSPEYGFGGP